MDLTVDRIKQEVAFRSSSLTILTTEETQLKLFENKTCSDWFNRKNKRCYSLRSFLTVEIVSRMIMLSSFNRG